MPERGFLIFEIFLLFFSPGRVWTEFGTKIFFSFSAYINPFWLKIMPERGFLIFWFFFQCFLEFSCLYWVWSEFRTKFFFFSFSAYLIPFWLEIMPEWGFLVFWIFLLFFFMNFLARVEYKQNSGLSFFFSLFLDLSHPVLTINIAGKRFFNFWNFFAFFFVIFSLGRVWTEFGTKIFFFFFFRPI